MEAEGAEERFILGAKVGNLSQIQILLQLRLDQSVPLDINCKCESKWPQHPLICICMSVFSLFFYVWMLLFSSLCAALSTDSLGWTPLHLASCWGHKDVVDELLKVSSGCRPVALIADW